MSLLKINQFMAELSNITTLELFKKQTLNQFDELFHLEHSIFWLCQTNNRVFSPTKYQIDEADFTHYESYYYKQDLLLPQSLLRNKEKTHFASMTDVVAPATFYKSEYYNDFLKPQNVHGELGLYLYNQTTLIGGISFVLKESGEEMTKKDRITFHLLAHYLEIKLHSLLHEDPYANIVMSPAEKRVFQRLLLGETDEQIADRLYLSIHTVKKHLRNMYEKNNVNSRTSLLAKINKVP